MGYWKRGVVSIALFLLLSSFVYATNFYVDTDQDIRFDWNFTGDSKFLTVGTDIEFNLTITNISSSQIITDFSCFVNIDEMQLEMTLDNNQFRITHTLNKFIQNGNYTILCNNSAVSIETTEYTYDVSTSLRPVIFEEYELIYTWMEFPVGFGLLNVTNRNFSEFSFVQGAMCSLLVDSQTYELVGDGNIYLNESVYFDVPGNYSGLVTCLYDSEEYNWTSVIEVREYASTFTFAEYDFGSTTETFIRETNLILRNNELISTRGADNYEIFEINEINITSKYSLQSSFTNAVISLISNNKILAIGEQIAKTFNVLNFDEGSNLPPEFEPTVAVTDKNSFLTTFDINNDGNYETISFFQNSSSALMHYILTNGTEFYQDSLTGLTDGFICYEDFTNNGYFDLIISGISQRTPSVTRTTQIFLNNGTHFNHNQTLNFGLSRGSCHISRIYNNTSSIILTGLTSAINRQIYLFDSFEDMLIENNSASTRLPGIPGLSESDIFVADFDNDGLKDILICGNTGSQSIAYYLKQNMTHPGTFFIQDSFPQHNISKCSISASHLNNSTGLDIAIGGVGQSLNPNNAGTNPISVLFNTPPREIQQPDAPEIINITFNDTTNQLFVAWTETHPLHSYTMKARYLNGTEIMEDFYPLSTHPAQGYLGNMRYRTNVTLHNIENGFVEVSIQTLDEALRKSEWVTDTITCDPTGPIDTFCPLSSDFPATNIVVVDNGILQLPNNFNSPDTNITFEGGSLIAQNFSVQSLFYNSTENISGIQTNAETQIHQDITITNSSFTNLTIYGSVILEDVTADPNVIGTTTIFRTTTFSFKDQFNTTLTNVSQNSSGSFNTNPTHMFHIRTITNTIPTEIIHTITFSKDSHYNKTTTIQPNATQKIILRRTPIPTAEGFDIISSFPFANDETQDLATYSAFNLTIGVEGVGKIDWVQPINISYANLSELIHIQNNSIFADPQLNTPANLTFYNISYNEAPVLLRDGVFCSDCTVQTDSENITAQVPGFSTYETSANAQLLLQSPSIIVTNESYSMLVLYRATNTSEVITDATCTFDDEDTIYELSLVDGFYTNTTEYSSAQTFNGTISCSAPGYESLSLAQEFRVVDEGVYFLIEDGGFEDIRLSSTGIFQNNLYYHGYSGSLRNFFAFENKNNVFNEIKSSSEVVLPFALTDINNNGEIQKIQFGDSAISSAWAGISGGTFITADIDDDGDIDIIYCGNDKFGIIENRFNENHNTASFTDHPKNEFGLDRCSMSYTIYNNTFYLAAQGSHQNGTKLFLFSINSPTNITLLNQTTGLQEGEIRFIDINNNGVPEIISSGYFSNEGDNNLTIYKLQNNQLADSILKVNQNNFRSSIIYTILPNETYPLILISGRARIDGQTVNHIEAYQYNGSELITRNEIIQDVQPFSRGSAVFFPQNDTLKLFTTGSNSATLYTYFNTKETNLTKPASPTITEVTYNQTTKELFIAWSEVPNSTYNLQVGERVRPHRFVSGLRGTSSNPIHNQEGNMFSRRNITLQNMPNTCFDIRIQAISNTYVESEWTEIQNINIQPPPQQRATPYNYDVNCDGVYFYPLTNPGPSISAPQQNIGPQVTTPETTQENNQETNQETESTQETTETPQTFGTDRPFEQFFTITHRNNRTFVEEEIKNIRRTRVTSAIVRKEFNKDILPEASLLQSINQFLIIRENPIIEFELGPMNYLESKILTYSLPGIIPEEKIITTQTVFRANQEFTAEQIAQIEAQQQQKAAEAIETIYRETVIDNRTQLTVAVNLQEGVEVAYDVEIEQFIPKCLLEEITDTILQAGIDQSLLNSVEIKEADPIIVWNFRELRHGQELTLFLDTLREEDCDDEVLIRTLARDYIQSFYEINQNNLNKALLLTGITILILLLMFVAATRDLSKHKKPHIDRLVKSILHQTHRNVPKDTIIQNLKNNKETDEDIKEAFQHIDQLHAFKKHKLTHTLTERGVEIIFFILLLILNLAEFTGFLPGYLDWIKKLISWALLLTILYKADLTKILFNISLPKINITILVAMLLMHLKNIVAFAETQSLERQTLFIFDLYSVILNHRMFFNETLFFIGAALLLIPTIYLGFKIQPREGSLYYVLSKKHTHNIPEKLARTSGIYILLLLFFFTIFNRVMEWLAVSIDAAVFILGIVILLTLFAGTAFLNKHKEEKNIFQVLEHKLAKNLSIIILGAFFILSIFKPFLPTTTTTITFAWLVGILIAVILYAIITNIRQHFSGMRHISTAIETIYLKFVRLFKYPGTLFLGISGLFILQQIVEIGLFIIPNITGKPTTLYDTHIKETVFTLFTNDSILARHLFQLTLQEQLVYGALYIVSIIGFFMLFFIPIYIWMLYFKHRAKHPTNLSLPELFKNKLLAIVAIPTIIIALLTDVLTFRYLNNLGTIGVFIEAGRMTLEYNYALLLIGGLLLYLIIIPFIETHTIRVYTTAWISIGALCIFYLTPFMNSLTQYIYDLLTSIQMPILASDALIIVIAAFLILDILIIYAGGLGIMLFLMLPIPVKRYIIKVLSHLPLFHRILFLSSDIRHLEYYDDTKEHVSGNLIYHLEKYVEGEINDGHHVETILYQLKIHGYPDHIIQEVIKDLAKHPRFLHEIEHLHPKNVRVDKVKELIPKVKKYTHKFSSQEIFERFQDSYKYYEIKLAIRHATQEHKKDIAISIENEEIKKIHELAKWIHNAFMHKRTRQEIVTMLISNKWDIELIMKIIDNPKFREKEFDIDRAKALAKKKKVAEKELQKYSYPELVYSNVKISKKLLEQKKKVYYASYEKIEKDIEEHYLKLK